MKGIADSTIDERGREVLKALIQLHIATGEPVGSSSLAQHLGHNRSSATLRNVMADLERQGLLNHPHTSAGRIPTDEGYRVYVDGMVTRRPLPRRDARTIESSLQAGEGSPRQLAESASHLLSQLSRHIGFVIAPDIARARFMHIDLVRLSHPRILVVMVSRSGFVANRVIELEDELTQEQLQACANYLNVHFAGMPLAAIRQQLVALLQEERAVYDSLLQRVLCVGELVFSGDDTDAYVYLDGTANMFAHPGFDDIGRVRTLIQTLEEKDRLVRILTACIDGHGVRVVIGRENPDPDWHDLSVVLTSYPLEGEPALGLGVLGSTRMEYARVMSLVDHVARAFSLALAEPT
jgi:heat-inducible transcriptional repressor